MLKCDMYMLKTEVNNMVRNLTYDMNETGRDQKLLLKRMQLKLNVPNKRITSDQFCVYLSQIKEYSDMNARPQLPNPQVEEVIPEQKPKKHVKGIALKRDMERHQRRVRAWFNGPFDAPFPEMYISLLRKHPISKQLIK